MTTQSATPGRYHLLLTIDSQDVMYGWWDSETTARRKWASTVGEYGRDGARITLTDSQSGTTLLAWPEPTTPGH